MPSPAEEERIRHQIRQLQQALEAVPEEPATLDSISKRLGDAEKNLLKRLNVSERVMLSQLDEQLLGTVMIVGLFVFTAFYVFYFLLENMLRFHRARLPSIGQQDIDLLVRAARYQCAVSEAKHVHEPAAQPAATAAV